MDFDRNKMIDVKKPNKDTQFKTGLLNICVSFLIKQTDNNFRSSIHICPKGFLNSILSVFSIHKGVPKVVSNVWCENFPCLNKIIKNQIFAPDSQGILIMSRYKLQSYVKETQTQSKSVRSV